MHSYWFLIFVAVFLLVLGGLETLFHRRNLRRIPIRIHVNGTRGKSSVTRLIAAGLRAGGIPTCAKTTGTLARMILPDGAEYPVFRPSGANVIEQLRIVSTAAAYQARALVVECMALQPPLQALCEQRIVRSTHSVITNARADHLDVMGPGEEDVAWALAGTAPSGGKLFTGERRHLDILRKAAANQKSDLVAIGDADVAAVSDEDMSGFRYVEHKENVALALAVCRDLGVDRRTALAGMWSATPDPGVMTVHEIEFFGRHMFFVNGFAANDPESTEKLWNITLDRFPDVEQRIALVNCRADRPDRSIQLGTACVTWRPADHYILIGSGIYAFARAATAAGMDVRKLVFAEDRRVDQIFEIAVGLSGRSSVVMGMANIGGQGLDLVAYFRNRSRLKEDS